MNYDLRRENENISMCGICGIYNLKNRNKINPDIVSSMMDTIRHRGPDGRDMLCLEQLVMGFVRLSFIDLGGGMQPIANEDETIFLVCNGEIFNYLSLRKELIEKGHRFRTKTDVEVIIHLYEECGERFVDYLNGQFAIAIYDAKNRQLLLVRDHFGIAPLFYTYVDGRLVFASEIKAIFEYPGVSRKLNLKALDQLMNFPGIVSPTTFFDGIYSLESGHMLKIQPESDAKNIEYWDIAYLPEDADEDKGEKYYVETLRGLLVEAIRKRLIADVPIGFYLSGGLDSSIVACFINHYIDSNHFSFSAEMMQNDYTEKKYQQLIKEHISSKHYTVQVSEQDLWQHIPEVVYYSEVAVKEYFDVAAFLLSELVSTTSVKAVLTGQGSDEFFNGYVGYVGDFIRMMQRNKMSTEECEINERLWGDPYFRYERNHYEIGKLHKEIYSKNVANCYDEFSCTNNSPIQLSKVRNLGTQRRRSYIDAKVRLADHLLGDHGDRMFFAHSIEGRHPFLDIDVVKFAISLPEKYKLRGTNEKYILKKAAAGIVPDDILRRKKFPFSAPSMSHMLKKKGDLYEQYLNDEIIRHQGIFNVNKVKSLKNQYLQEKFDLKGAYEIDYLQVIITTTMLCEKYGLNL